MASYGQFRQPAKLQQAWSVRKASQVADSEHLPRFEPDSPNAWAVHNYVGRMADGSRQPTRTRCKDPGPGT